MAAVSSLFAGISVLDKPLRGTYYQSKRQRESTLDFSERGEAQTASKIEFGL